MLPELVDITENNLSFVEKILVQQKQKTVDYGWLEFPDGERRVQQMLADRDVL